MKYGKLGEYLATLAIAGTLGLGVEGCGKKEPEQLQYGTPYKIKSVEVIEKYTIDGKRMSADLVIGIERDDGTKIPVTVKDYRGNVDKFLNRLRSMDVMSFRKRGSLYMCGSNSGPVVSHDKSGRIRKIYARPEDIEIYDIEGYLIGGYSDMDQTPGIIYTDTTLVPMCSRAPNYSKRERQEKLRMLRKEDEYNQLCNTTMHRVRTEKLERGIKRLKDCQ
ncbi:MAG: hypothetical protein DRP03_03125 [Candidatus Aenigmatarchaeota archaeon]|nr:MAG: hypothetical protein DRP03_03125 [Candidatus Aenigmarchaeota archaeon]